MFWSEAEKHTFRHFWAIIRHMAKVSYVDLPPGYEDLYKKVLQPGDRFEVSRVRVKDIFLSRARVKGITLRSQFLELAPVWDALTTDQKNAWEAAGAMTGLTGWKAFVRDTTQRRKAGISGYATPNLIYQGNVGRMTVEAPANGLTLVQAHPITYYVLRKVRGTKSQYAPVAVFEPFGLPLEITVSWKTNLTSTSGDWRARFFCVVYSSYQGRDIETVGELSFGLTDEWQRNSFSVENVIGIPRGYTVFVEIHNARGDLWFDMPYIIHNGENWARDPRCDNISQGFTKAFYQVARAWVAEDPAAGTDFGSVYFDS